MEFAFDFHHTERNMQSEAYCLIWVVFWGGACVGALLVGARNVGQPCRLITFGQPRGIAPTVIYINYLLINPGAGAYDISA
jgi:hypothetical protein